MVRRWIVQMTVQEAMELAAGHHQAGRLPQAEALYRQVLAVQPLDAQALNQLGVLYSQAGHQEAALEHLNRAISCNPGSAVYRSNAGLVLTALKRVDEGIARYKESLVLRPDFAEAYKNLAEALKVKGMLNRAVEAYHAAAGRLPDEAQAWNYLAIALQSEGRSDEAIAAHRQAVALRPDVAEYKHDMGTALQQRGRLDQGLPLFQSAVEMSPGHAGFHNSLGYAFLLRNQWDQAVDCFRRALALQPDLAMAHNNLANLLRDLALHDESIEHYERAMALEPHLPMQHSNRVLMSYYHPASTPAGILHEQKRWEEQHAAPLRAGWVAHENDRSPDRRIRIGYVSGDFRHHALGCNVLPLLQHHDHQRFEVFCYSNVLTPDAVTARFQSYADQWREIGGLSDESAAAMIRADRIDILIDLSLHSAANRLPIFARKPAPVQATFAGYPAGTGLHAMDYRISDPHLDPPEMEAHYVEQTLRLPDSFWCYDPAAMGAANAPAPSALPALQNGFVTFGCLNNFCKVNDNVLALWSRVLMAVEGARLLLMAPAGRTRERVIDQFQRNGIDVSRLISVDRCDQQQYFKLYHRFDIGLDTFPYNGHTTSLDSTFMGVPVVTLLGETSVGRAGWSQLSNLGLTELAAHTPAEFVEIAAGLARDLPRLAELRGGLRSRMLQSPLGDIRRFAPNVETLYAQMWHTWCAGGGVSR